MDAEILDPRRADPKKDEAVEKLYRDVFDTVPDKAWRDNQWSLKEQQLKDLQRTGQGDPKTIAFMKDNYGDLRNLSAEKPMPVLQNFYPTHLGENNPKLWDYRGQFLNDRNNASGISLDDVRLFHELGIEKNRQNYIETRVKPDSEHAASAYGFWGGLTGFLASDIGIMSAYNRLAAIGGWRAGAIAVGVMAASTYIGHRIGSTEGRQFVIDEYADLQKKVDAMRDKL